MKLKHNTVSVLSTRQSQANIDLIWFWCDYDEIHDKVTLRHEYIICGFMYATQEGFNYEGHSFRRGRTIT